MPIDLLSQFKTLSVYLLPAFHKIYLRIRCEPTRDIDQLQSQQDRRSCCSVSGGKTSFLQSDFFKGDFFAGVAESLLLVSGKLEHSPFRRALK